MALICSVTQEVVVVLDRQMRGSKGQRGWIDSAVSFMQAWSGEPGNKAKAQDILVRLAKANSSAQVSFQIST